MLIMNSAALFRLTGVQTVLPSDIDSTSTSTHRMPTEKPLENPTSTSAPARRGILFMKLARRKLLSLVFSVPRNSL